MQPASTLSHRISTARADLIAGRVVYPHSRRREVELALVIAETLAAKQDWLGAAQELFAAETELEWLAGAEADERTIAALAAEAFELHKATLDRRQYVPVIAPEVIG